MRIKLATFNVENLFDRCKAMNGTTWSEGQPVLDAAGRLNSLFNKETYSDTDKMEMLQLLGEKGLLTTWSNNKYPELRKMRGMLFRKVAGDLNGHPNGGSPDNLLGKELKDAMNTPVYTGFPGTDDRARADQKIDYLLMSPRLIAGVQALDVNLKGFNTSTKWTSYPNITG